MKKIFTILYTILFALNPLLTGGVYAVSNFELQTFTIKVNGGNAQSGNVYIKPLDVLSILIGGQNKGDFVNNPNIEFSFSNNNFIYNNPGNIISYLNGTIENENISISEFNPPLDNTASLSSSSNNGDFFYLFYLDLKINSDATDYFLDIGAKFIADGYSGSNQITRRVYVNVNPHITDYSFSKSSISNNGTDTVDLTLKVKDYNGCTNIDGGTVTANLSQLGLTSSENLTYNSCEADGKTAVFKKTGIQTTGSVGNKTFTYDLFSATDEDGNQNMPDDANTTFDDEDKKDDLAISVISSDSPNVSITRLDDNYTGPNESGTSNQFSFSANQGGNYDIKINTDCFTSGGISISSGSYNSGSTVDLLMNSYIGNLNEGSNLIYACVQNSLGDIGSANISITKDSVNPGVSGITVGPANVVTEDSTVSFTCSENGQYKINLNGSPYQDWTNANSGISNSVILNNGNINLGENPIEILCRDNALNIGTGNAKVTKQESTPSMSGQATSLNDNDTSWIGIDGRDITVSWDTSVGAGFTGFESYRIYILPNGTALDTNIHNFVGIVANSATSTWTGPSSLTKDSAGNDFQEGTYKAYVAIMGKSGELGTAGETSGDLVYDNITEPTLQSAKFIADNTLQLEFDIDLKTDIAQHLSYSSDSVITYEIGGSTFTGTSVQSVSGKKINIEIPSLGNTSSVGTNLFLGTGSIRENGGGYISATGGFLISDGISPEISNFTGATTPAFTTGSGANFYTGTLDFSYDFSEEMKAGGDTKFEFIHESGNADPTPKYSYLTATSDLSAGAKTYSIDIDSLGLISGTCHKVKISGKDLAENISETNFIENICYDNVGPSVPVLVPFPNNLDENDNYSAEKRPTLTWFSSSDNLNESGLKEYNLQVSTVSDFSTNFIDINIGTETYTFTEDLLDGQYFWRVRGVDNVSNNGEFSVSSDFEIDASSATISNILFNDITRGVNNVEYSSTGRTIDIIADVSNSSGSCIRADLSNIGLGTGILADSFVGGVASWNSKVIGNNTEEGLREIFISAKNSQCIGDIFTNGKNIGIDNTLPQIGTGITFPLNGDFLSGEGNETTKIYWNALSIVEQNFNYLKINFFNGTDWQNIGNNLLNLGEFSYDFPDLNISDAKISIEVFDKAGNSATQTGTEFVLDSIIPTFDGTNVLKYPNGGEKLKGGDEITITWSGSLITDSNLADNPISLFYSVDGGTNFLTIFENLANSDSYNWTVPNLNSETLKIKILAKDKAGNENFDLSDGNFSIDSTKPTKISSKLLDLNENGKLDTLEIIFSENILDSSVNIGDFSLNNGYVINNFNPTLNGDSANNNKIYLSITENGGDCNISNQTGCDTDAVLTLTYNQDGEGTVKVSDIVGNTLENFSETISDGISPIVLGREVLDSDNDGILDQVKIYFSETMDASQVSNLSFALESSLGLSFTEIYNQAQADSNSLILGFSDGVEFNTSDLVKSKILTSEFMDLAGNSAKIDSDFVSSSDKARPIFKAEAQKISGQEKIKITFSENVNISNVGTWNISDGIIINSTETGSNFITFDVSEITDTGLTPTVTYSVLGDIQDGSSNLANTGFVTSVDKISPEIISAETLDINSNGNIDRVRLTFSENISDSTLIPGNFSIGTSVATSFETGTSNDNIGEIVFSTEIKGTDLKDLIYNGTSVEDSVGNKLQNIQSGDLTGTDGAGPAIISAYYIEGATVEDDEIIINFSENISDASLEIGDFAVEGTGNVSNGTITTGNADDNQIKIELNSGDTRLIIGSSKIKFSGAGVVDDLNSNSNSQAAGITVNGSVIINEINWAGSSKSTSDEYIELKNMGSNPVNISNWIIENATNGGNLTISSGTIPGNGYFLISNFDQNNVNSVLNIAPDLIDTNLDLANSGNGDLILKDSGNNIMDSAIGNWPEGDSINFYSMERKENPGDGLDASSWYTANGRTNLDEGTEKGTPGAENIFDADAPIFDLNTKYPLENSLHLISQPEISIEYSDVLTGIDTTNSKLYLDWNQDGTCELLAGSAIFTQNKVTITPGASMPFGKNKVCIELFDNAGNQSNISWDFWIEKFTFNVEEISPISEILTPTVDEIFSGKTKITIETYGAGLNISSIFENLTAGTDEILDQDMFYDSKLVKNGNLVHDYNGYLNISNTNLETISKVEDLTIDGNLKTYEIYLNYKFNINAIQPTGNYNGSVRFVPEISY